MQKADGSEARALVASEIAALLIMAMLPYFRKCYKDSLTEQEFALRCRYIERFLGLPPFSVQNPFTISFDNATTHPESRKMASCMWQEHLDARGAWDAVSTQYKAVFEAYSKALEGEAAAERAATERQPAQQSDEQAAVQHAQASLQPGAQQARVPVLARSQLQLPAVAPLRGDSDTFRETAEVQTSLSHAPPAGKETEVSIRTRARVLSQTNGDKLLEELKERVQAYDDICDADPTACGFASQQFLSLVDKTPDINSGAENNVYFHKNPVTKAVREWMFDPAMQDDLELAATYWNKCKEQTARLNTPNGLVTCRATVINALARVKVLAAPKGAQIKVIKAKVLKPKDGPYSLVEREHEATGSGGGWIAEGVFSG